MATLQERLDAALEARVRQTEDAVEEEYIDPYHYIVAMDPGGTTGLACLRIDPEDPSVPPALVYLHQIEDGRPGFKKFFKGSSISPNVTMVSEKWRERNIKGADRTPQYIEGMIDAFWDEENVEWQYPDQKELIPDEWLKEQNLWTPDKRHQMDALKHAFAYLRNQGHSATLDALTDEGSETLAQPGEAEAAQLGEGDAGPEGGEGEGGTTATSFIEQLQQIAESMKRLDEQAQANTELIKEHLEAEDEAEDEAEGGEYTGGFGTPPEDTRNRSKREINGAFAGYNPADEELGSTTVLFED